MKVKIWTRGYRPLIIGGDVNAPICCTVEAKGPVALANGYRGYVIKSPQGKTYIAETETGGIVGTSIEHVRRDIKEADPKELRQIIKDAKAKVAKAVPVSAAEFWRQVEG